MITVTRMLVGFIVLVCLSLVWGWWQQILYVPIKVVSVNDKLQYTDPNSVKSAIADEIKKGFFGMQMTKMREQLLMVPWVLEATLERQWPHTLIVQLQERAPLARFGKTGIIDTTGRLFYPKENLSLQKNLQVLPEFIGDEHSINSMVSIYLQILSKVKPLGLTVRQLVLKADSGWRTKLDNGLTIILGNNSNELEERLSRFVLAYNDAKSGLRDSKVEVVDLRYTNGMAVS